MVTVAMVIMGYLCLDLARACEVVRVQGDSHGNRTAGKYWRLPGKGCEDRSVYIHHTPDTHEGEGSLYIYYNQLWLIGYHECAQLIHGQESDPVLVLAYASGPEATSPDHVMLWHEYNDLNNNYTLSNITIMCAGNMTRNHSYLIVVNVLGAVLMVAMIVVLFKMLKTKRQRMREDSCPAENRQTALQVAYSGEDEETLYSFPEPRNYGNLAPKTEIQNRSGPVIGSKSTDTREELTEPDSESHGKDNPVYTTELDRDNHL